MRIETCYRRPRSLVQLREGPLGNYIDLFADQLQREGHCQEGAWRNLHVVGDFSRWLARKHLGFYDVDEQIVSSYLSFLRRHLRPSVFECPALMRMLAILREIEASHFEAVNPLCFRICVVGVLVPAQFNICYINTSTWPPRHARH